MNFLKRLLRANIYRTKEEVRSWQDPDHEEVPTVCDEIKLEGIDSALYGKLLAEAAAGGIRFDGSKANLHSGPISLEFDWDYDQVAQTLYVTCTKKPFIFGCKQIEMQINELVAKAKQGAL